MKAAQFLDDPGEVFEITTMSKHSSVLKKCKEIKVQMDVKHGVYSLM